MTTENASLSFQMQRNTTKQRRQEWRENMTDRTFSLEDQSTNDEINISSISNQQEQSSFECRFENIPIYSWIESNLYILRTNLFKRGLNENDLNEKEQTIINNLKTYLQDLIEFETKENDNLLDEIRIILNKCCQLNRLLKLDYNIKEIENDSLTLFEQLNHANKLLEKFDEILKIKLKEIDELKMIEKQICEKLNEIPIELESQYNEIPYDQRKEILEEHIEKLENLQNDRLTSIEHSRNQICQFKIELELKQLTNDCQLLELIDQPLHLIELSDVNVQQLLSLAQQLNNSYQTNRMKADQHVNTLHSLYERLNLTQSDRCIKLPLDKSHRPENLILLEKEIERCKNLRRENLRIYIENLRDEIFAQYEKCFYGREQMESFLPLYSNEFTEDLLEEHEKELEEINIYYKHNEQLFTNLAHWHEIWAEYREFQKQASDPDRFKRRGYSAIQEEKQRKHLEFTLKKVQDIVLQLSKDYEQEFGHQFLVEGVAVQDFFNHEKENYSQEKELEKARKQLARGQTPTNIHSQGNIKRLEMSTKTPGRQQQNKEIEIKPSTPFRPASAIGKR